MNIRPLHDRVVVRRLEEETTTAGGIVLPDSGRREAVPRRGAGRGSGQGSGQRRSPRPGRQGGRQIIFGQYGGSTVKIEGDELLILSESEIFGVLEG